MLVNNRKRHSIKANKTSVNRQIKRRVVAEDEMEEVVVSPEATELLFEAEDVAQLLAEATGETVEVEVTDDAVEFTVGDNVLTAEAEGTEEILEASRKVLRGKRPVGASRRINRRR